MQYVYLQYVLYDFCRSATVNSDSEINNLKSSGVFEIKNPYLKDLDEDVLFHLQLSTKKHDLKAMFHDVRVSVLTLLLN